VPASFWGGTFHVKAHFLVWHDWNRQMVREGVRSVFPRQMDGAVQAAQWQMA